MVLSIRVGVEDGLNVVTAEEPAALKLLALLSAEDEEGTEEVLADSVKTLAEAAGKVGGLERDLELLVKLVLGDPDAPALSVEVLPEPGHGVVRVASVRVLSLPGIHDEVALGELAEGGDGVNLLLLGLLLLGLLGLGGLSSGGGGLLGLSLGLDGGLDKGDGANNLDELGLVGNSLEPAGHVDKLLAGLGVENKAEGKHEGDGDSDIGEGDGAANEEGLSLEVLLEDGKGSLELLEGTGGDLGHVLGEANDGVDSHGGGDLDLVGAEVDPGLDLGLLKGVLANELGLAGSDELHGGVAGEEAALLGLEHGEALSGGLALDVALLDAGHDLEAGTSILGSDDDLLGTEGAGASVQLHGFSLCVCELQKCDSMYHKYRMKNDQNRFD